MYTLWPLTSHAHPDSCNSTVAPNNIMTPPTYYTYKNTYEWHLFSIPRVLALVRESSWPSTGDTLFPPTPALPSAT